MRSTIEELVPNERLRTSSEGRQTEFVLEGHEGTTVLRIVQSGFGEDELESLGRGWTHYVQTLRHYLAHHLHEPADSTYCYAKAQTTIADARRVLSDTLPPDAEVVDDGPRTLGARVPELGDGVYRASIEGADGQVLAWVHLVAYGSGRGRLAEITSDVERKLVASLRRQERQATPV